LSLNLEPEKTRALFCSLKDLNLVATKINFQSQPKAFLLKNRKGHRNVGVNFWMVSFEMDDIILKCREYCQQMSVKDLHHGFEHSLRVCRYALEIGKQENADLWVVEIASYLHDIGRGHEEGEYHTETSSRLARSFLKKLGLPENQIERVTHCVETHSRKEQHRKTPKTLEAQVLYDADGLEMIGAVGILRIALSSVVSDRGWNHILKKAKWRLDIIDDFLTPSGKTIAKTRKKLVNDFANQLTRELETSDKQKV
jgi:uncharacterized protein